MAIQLKRVYDAERTADGVRFLVERLWPRGIKKADLKLDGWLKDAAPGTELRKWFSHDPAKWDEFRQRYFAELTSNPDGWRPILDAARPRAGDAALQFARHRPQQRRCAEAISGTPRAQIRMR